MKRSIATCVALLCGLWVGGAAGPRAAFADEAWGLVRITCVPEARYFSIRRFVLMNPRADYDLIGREASKSHEKLVSELAAHGIYTSSRLKETPVQCDLFVLGLNPDQTGRERRIRLRAEGFFQNLNDEHTSSYRRMIDRVDVSANGKAIAWLHLNPWGQMVDPTDLVEVAYDGTLGQLTTCSYHGHPEAQQPKGCIVRDLKDVP